MWYAAHIIMYVRFKDGQQGEYPVWENIRLIEAPSDDGALAVAECLGRDDEGDDDGSFRWDGRPATWVFGGVRKLVAVCHPDDPDDRPTNGAEISYSQMILPDAAALDKLVNGDPVTVLYEE